MLESSWRGKHIGRIDAEGAIDTIITGLTEPACFDVDEAHHQLLVPGVKPDTVSVHPLAPG